MYVGRTDGDGIDYMHPPGGFQDPVGDAIGPYWYHERIEGEYGWQVERRDGGLGEDFSQLGFEVWKGGWRHYKDWLMERGLEEFARTAGNHDALQSAPEGNHMYSRLGEENHMATYFTNETERFILENKGKEQPWSAVLSYFGPHLPVAPPQPWDTLYAMEEVALPDNFNDDLSNKPKGQFKPDLQYVLGQWTEDQYKDYIRRYWGYTSYIDDQIGRILELLRNTGQWDNTIIVFTSDHGDMVSGHGMIYKIGSNAYEELYHVPAVIRVPGIESHKIIESLVSSIDLLPTILAAAKVEIPSNIDGKNLMPLLKGESNSFRKEVYAEMHSTGPMDKMIMMRNERYKYVYHWQVDDVDELYDLYEDPGELNNLYLSEDHKELVESMSHNIIKWAEDTGHEYAHLIKEKAYRSKTAN